MTIAAAARPARAETVGGAACAETVGGAARPPRARSLGAAVDALRAHGLRVTTPRRRVLAALYASPEPVSAEDLAAGADVASVYRNLETLETVGLVQHVHLGHGPGRYALREPSGWAACERCGRHERLAGEPLAQLRRLVREATGLDAGFDHFPIVGLCPECANVH
jgi:Fur family transcriptional regulator, ferric uptake regulator